MPSISCNGTCCSSLRELASSRKLRNGTVVRRRNAWEFEKGRTGHNRLVADAKQYFLVFSRFSLFVATRFAVSTSRCDSRGLF